MKINELKDKQGGINIDLRIIWISPKSEHKFGRDIQMAIVADIDSEQGPTAYLDIYDKDVMIYGVADKIKVIDAYSKLVQNGKGQMRLTNCKGIELIEKGEVK